MIPADPAQGMEVGADEGTAVGEYASPATLSGIVDEPRLYFQTFSDEDIAKRYEDGSELGDTAVIAASFDDGSARDHSLSRNSGTVKGAKIVDGKFGKALQFSPGKKGGAKPVNQGNSLVKPKWTQDLPIYVRAMTLSGYRLFLVGPPDIINEEETFKGLTEDDPKVQALLAKQDEVLDGHQGGKLLVVNTVTGKIDKELQLDVLPTWDGLAGANGKLFLSTLDGQLICFE